MNVRAPEKSRRVRVLLIGPSLRYVGGQAVQARNLLERLWEDGRVEADFLPVDPALPGPLGLLQKVKYLRTAVTTLAYTASLLARVRRYDVAHIYSASYWSFLLAPAPALLVCRMYGCKAVLNYHSGEAEDHLRRWRSAAPVIRLADRLLTPSEYLVDVFARFGLKAEFIYNFVDTERFRFRARKPLRPVFLSNRNLEALYNVACILRAFARIQAECPYASLLIAGDGSQRAMLEELARELGLHDVEFLGKLPPAKMHELYSRADIYLNSSNIDNMPISILEAYASGLAVATTDAGGIPYIVHDGETGLLAPMEDYEALAEAAMRYLREPDFAERVVNRAREECRLFSWPAVRNRWVKLYEELAGQGRRR